MSLDSIVLQVSIACPRCHQPLHVQGLTHRAHCGSCASAAELSDETWLGWFDATAIAEALRLEEGQAKQITSMGGLEAKYEYGRWRPRCTGCKRETPLEQLETYAAAGGYRCACGQHVAVRRADALSQRVVPGARFVVNEGPLGGDEEPVASAEPVMFQCMGCGGALRIDGRERNVRCTFCSGSNYLPDALWFRLHPPRVVRSFFVVAAATEGGRPTVELLERLARSSDWEARRLVARDPKAPEEVLRLLVHDSDSDVREALATNPGVSEALLRDLAADEDSDVRSRVALRANTPLDALDALDALLRDDDYDVRRAAVRNARLPAERLVAVAERESDRDVLASVAKRSDLSGDVLAALARNGDYAARVHAAEHRSTPHEALRELALDRDSDVRDAMSRRDDLPDDVVLAMVREAVAQHHDDVLRAVLRRPTLPRDAVLAAAGYEYDDRIRQTALSHPVYLAHRSARRRRAAIVGAVLAVFVFCTGLLGAGGLAAFVGVRQLLRAMH